MTTPSKNHPVPAQTESLFDRIEPESISDLVVRQIEEMIIQGILIEGQRLPSERDLAARFDVSRPKVRDAIKTLEANGLLAVKHGEGTFVAQLSHEAMTPALIDLFARHGLAFYDYLEYRRAQEGLAARLAATRATETDHAAIRTHLAALERAHEVGDRDASMEADVAFHSALVNASHNVMLIHMMTSIYDLTRRGVFYNRLFLRSLDGSGLTLLNQHRAIAEAVISGDPVAAAAATDAHLAYVEQCFRVGEDQQRRDRNARKRLAALGTPVPDPQDAAG